MHKYLKSHIIEEVEGAIGYLTKAIELKPTHPLYAEKFYRMSEMELEHANCLTKMFNSLDKNAETTAEDFSLMQSEVINIYSTSMSQIESMKKMYHSL